MFSYGPTAESPSPASAPGPKSGGPLAALALGVARRHALLVATTGVLGALAAFGGAKLVTPRYVATAEIYVDPGAAQGSETQTIAAGQDSNGFVNYVESQALILSSRSVLERVVKSEGLERDPEFSASAGSLLLGGLTGAASSARDATGAAARALGASIQVKRPERTFVLQVSASSRTPERAAELANAVAKAYIDEVAALREDAAKQSASAIGGRLEALRKNVISAERAVEDYKAANNLTGAPSLLVESRLKAINDQLVAVRARMSEAQTRADQVEAARRSGGDSGAFAASFGLPNLTPLRAQQADARQKLADAQAELGPRHPSVIDAAARLTAANAAVDAELTRFSQSQRLEYQRAKALEASLTKQLDALKGETDSGNRSEIDLRDLERKSAAAREVYELFVTKSRDTGEIREVEPVRTKIISEAGAPKSRAFPPSSAALAGIGFLAGLALGLILAFWREGRASPRRVASPARREPLPDPESRPQRPPSPSASAAQEIREILRGWEPLEAKSAPALAAPRGEPWRLRISLSGASRPKRMTAETLDLSELGFPTLGDDPLREFDEVFQEIGLDPGRKTRVIALTGPNDKGQRTSIAIHLALAAAGDAEVALLDSGGRSSRLARAVRLSLGGLGDGAVYETRNGILLALPQAEGLDPAEALADLLRDEDRLDLVICDGPDAGDGEAGALFDQADALILCGGEEDGDALDEAGFAADGVIDLGRPARLRRRA